MGWIFAILVGGLVGWIASVVMKTDGGQGPIANVVIGIIGSVLGKWLFSDVLGIGGAAIAGSFTVMGLVWGVMGAIVLIALLKMMKVA